LVDLAIVLVARLRGPDHCVVNVLGMVLPELLILYLFFFYFSWPGWGTGFKNGGRGSSRLPVYYQP
jgi:hypothetical protein